MLLFWLVLLFVPPLLLLLPPLLLLLLLLFSLLLLRLDPFRATLHRNTYPTLNSQQSVPKTGVSASPKRIDYSGGRPYRK